MAEGPLWVGRTPRPSPTSEQRLRTVEGEPSLSCRDPCYPGQDNASRRAILPLHDAARTVLARPVRRESGSPSTRAFHRSILGDRHCQRAERYGLYEEVEP